MTKEFSKDVSGQITKNLQEFGYSSLTEDFVHNICTQLIESKAPDDTGGVIAMFAKGTLIKNSCLE